MMAEKKRRQSGTRRRKPAKPSVAKTLTQLLKQRKNRDAMDFKPDVQTATWMKTARLTHLQQLRLTKWLLYILTVVMSLVVQDVVMSQVSIFGATTDLPACSILLITVIEGTEIGSLFVLIASTLYYFSGHAPTAWCIALLTFLGIGATLFRQLFWHRSKGSIILCSAIALSSYEIGLFAVGLTKVLTRWGRLPVFLLTAVLSCLALVPLYSLIYQIGQIGGNTWKE